MAASPRATSGAPPRGVCPGVRRVLGPPGIPLAGPGYALEYDGADARVYRNDRALPRAFLVPSARCVDDATALTLIAAREVDFRQEVLLGGCERVPEPGLPGHRRRALIRRAEPSRGHLDTTAHAP